MIGVMRSKSKEDYIGTLYHLKEEHDSVRSVDLAEHLGISKPSVSEMVDKLSDEGLVNKERYGQIELTKKGLKLAKDITNKRRIIELFLKEIVGLGEKELKEEAHRLEHAFSDKSVDKIRVLLNNPKVCPHGKPIK